MAVGLDDYLGSLEEGKRGDFIVVDLKHLNLNPVLTRPVRNYIFNLVYSSFGNEVSHVFVDGEPKVVDGKVTFVDEDSVVDKANEMALDLMDKAAGEYIDIDSMMVKYLWRGLI
jgi:5-methylthioadenosine/S-adenosylhomocysteine deaminase